MLFKCTVTDSPFNTQANGSKCPPSAWIHFSGSCDQRTCNLTEHCKVVDAFCNAEISPDCCELASCVYGLFGSESALELNPEVVTLNPETLYMYTYIYIYTVSD